MLLAPWLALGATQTIVVSNAAGQPVANAVVSIYLKGVKATAAPNTIADMAQRHKSFVPSVLAIQTGTLVNFPNFDTVRHHVYSFSPIKTFEIKLYAGTPTAPILFDKPGTATLGCNIHDRMLGYIHVVDTPYFGVTDTSGAVTLDIPPGEHKARIWSPEMGENKPDQEQDIKTSAAPIAIRMNP
jgi:plastocyanin